MTDSLETVTREIAEKWLSQGSVLNDAFMELPDRMSDIRFRVMCERSPELWSALIDVVSQWQTVMDQAELEYAEDCAERKLRKGYMG